ncbi:Polysaccharide biosynthesis protein [Qipengyuania citrea LAMA 915]|uniref:Polysaccharide biosynthesis protein n=1 Tax=Qipengyuania citrea LAMA 915 TaxID=1306953 RepID=A0A0L1KHX0_9SPHN|nr:oligosaccharide flippase family protein [Qipengyuania citrea]KNH03424.1 Polysaccharide biosynthesis protein [Qipengyuania citrea LAMA 915]
MTAAPKTSRAALQILFGQGSTQVLSFLRNLLIARLVSIEDFGVAATFALTISILQVISDLSWDKMLVQSPNGDDPEMQSTIQLMVVTRGALMALTIFLLADEFATFFGAPEAAWAYQIIALTPLIRGFDHLDFKRAHRRLDFSLEAQINIVSQLGGLAGAAVGIVLFVDYRAMLTSILAQALVYTFVSHARASRPYRVTFSKPTFVAGFSFGWPLALNSVIFFLATQGDRLVVGGWLGTESLALYTSIILIQGAVLTLLMSVLGNIGLSTLSHAKNTNGEFSETCSRLCVYFNTVTVVIFIPLIFVCYYVVIFAFGERYQSSFEVCAVLVVGAGINLLRAFPITVQLALGRTKQILLSNVVRTSGFFAALIAVQLGEKLSVVALCMVLGEILAVISAFLVLSRSGGAGSNKDCAYITAISSSLLVASAMLAIYLPGGFLLHATSGVLVSMFALAGLSLLSRTTRSVLHRLAKQTPIAFSKIADRFAR